MVHDFHRPLGLAEQREARRPRRRHLPGLAVASLATAVVGGSLYTALDQPAVSLSSWLTPAEAPVSADPQVPVELATATPDTQADAMAAERPALPSIVRMNADGGVTVVEVEPFEVDPAYTGSIRVLEPGSLRQNERFAHVPDETLLETTAFGDLPRRATDGRRPLDVYAGAHSNSAGTRVALVVGGLGISQTGTQAAINVLPANVTLAFAASGNSLDRWMQAARRSGHELLLQAPMEPFGYPSVSPGPDTLTVEAASAGDLDALHRAMARLTNYVGIVNFMGGRLTAETSALEPLLAEVSRRGLVYIDDGSSARSRVRDVALAGSVPFAIADRTIDGNRDPAAIRAELDTLERSARAGGSAIGFASAFDSSVRTITEWVAEAEKRGVEIVPVSALAFDPEAQ